MNAHQRETSKLGILFLILSCFHTSLFAATLELTPSDCHDSTKLTSPAPPQGELAPYQKCLTDSFIHSSSEDGCNFDHWNGYTYDARTKCAEVALAGVIEGTIKMEELKKLADNALKAQIEKQISSCGKSGAITFDSNGVPTLSVQ